VITYLRKFLYILSGKHKQLILLAFLILLTSALETLGIGLVGPFIGLASNSNLVYESSWLNWFYVQSGLQSVTPFLALLGLITVGIVYLKSIISFHVQKYIFNFTLRQQGEIACKLMHAYLNVPYVFHLNRNTALLIQNVTGETARFGGGFMLPLLSSVSNLAVIIALILLLAGTNLVATLSIAALLLPSFYIIYLFKDKISEWGKKRSQASSEMIRIINHSLGGLKETRIIGCEPYFEAQLSKQAQILAEEGSAFQVFSVLPRIILEALLFTFLVGFAVLFLLFNQNGQNLTAVLGVFAMASIRLLPSVSNMLFSLGTMRNTTHSVNILYSDLKELEKTEEDRYFKGSLITNKHYSTNWESQPVHQGLSFRNAITLDNIIYRYPSVEQPSLKGVSLTIKRGQAIGLIGRSGAGKTTLVDVILGLLEPESGDIRVDGASIYRDLRSWQNLIGYIPQSIFLTDDTLERNIAFGVPDHQIDQSRLADAIEAAQLTELIDELPKGIQTVVGERGVRLSGGQRQRVGIARVLYHQREILVLDEATAALDNETESLVNQAIKSLSGTKTLIIIAHRLSTIEHCDCIYLLEKGCLVKSGSYQEVVMGAGLIH
jgi:ABC-type multidrug transport system fused ATPase/permease subunit